MRIAGIRVAGLENRTHAHAIAAFVQSRGAAYSSEVLDEFGISEMTLRRRRPQLARLGVRFVPNGRGSVYTTEPLLAYHLPTKTEHAGDDLDTMDTQRARARAGSAHHPHTLKTRSRSSTR